MNKKKIEYPNVGSEFVALRSYCRWLPEEERRESWEEVVDRVINFLKTETRHADRIPNKVWTSIEDSMLDFSVMPSMRLVATAGPAAKKDNVCMYNCSYLPIDSLKSFAELLYILMCGTGAGFSVEDENISKIPMIKFQSSLRRDDYVIEDSREGWAKAFLFGLETWYNGEDVRFDYSKLREYGAPLKTMGGRSSGPDPLKELMKFAKDIIFNANGRKLNSLECHDICCKIAEVVVVGGTRRSALISFSDLNDHLMQHAKDFPIPPHRFMANNSAVYKDKPDNITFLKEWSALAESGSGERGIINVSNLNVISKDRKFTKDIRFNPCQPYWAKILTPTGIKNFGELIVGDKIWSSEGWTTVVNKISTGIKKVYKYQTTQNIFYGTENHRILSDGIKIEVKNANSIDVIKGNIEENNEELNIQDIMDGLVIGDGSVHKASNNKVHLYIGSKDQDYFKSEIKDLIIKQNKISKKSYDIKTTIEFNELSYTYLRSVPKRFFESSKSIRGFLRGLFSANGTVVSNRISLKASSKQIIEDVQLMLNSIGINSYFTTNKEQVIKFNNGEYLCKQSYDLNITTDRMLFKNKIGFIQQYKNDKIKNIKSDRHKKIADIINIEFISEEEVFDITVNNKSHTYWTQGCNVSNCGEILLRPYELCNLSEAVIRANDDIGDLVDKVTTATWLGVIQSTFTHFPFLRPEWKKNCEEERLIGVSLTGQLDNPEILSEQVLKQLKKVVMKIAKHAADILEVNAPKAYTCTKPSGTVSQVVDSASGCHPRYSKYYIRRYRISTSDPLYNLMRDQGVPYKPEVGQTEDNATTMVLEFPIKSPDKAITTRSWDAMDQLNWYLKVQKNWSTHNVSNTVYVKKNEWIKIGAWVYDHFDEIVGISFLPLDDHIYELAPYEEIDEKTYNILLKEFPNLNFTVLGEYEKLAGDKTEAAKTYACVGNSCELK